MWVNIELANEIHTVPLEDIREHKTTKDCWCNPEIEEEYGLVIHNAADEREKFESGERKPS